MTRSDANRRPPGSLAKAAAYRDAVGLSPAAFDVIVAVMAFTTGFHKLAFAQLTTEQIASLSPTAASPDASDVRAFLGVHDLSLNELVGGMWLTVEGVSNGSTRKRLTARARAWNTMGFSRDERRSA